MPIIFDVPIIDYPLFWVLSKTNAFVKKHSDEISDEIGDDGALWSFVARTVLGDHCKIHIARLRRGPGTGRALGVVGVSKTDSGYAWTVAIIKLGCVLDKRVIGLLLLSLNVWRLSKI